MSAKTKFRCRVLTVEIEGMAPTEAVELLAALAQGLNQGPLLPVGPKRSRRAKKKPQPKA